MRFGDNAQLGRAERGVVTFVPPINPGANLLSNGTFATDTAGWTLSVFGEGTLVAVAGKGRVTSGAIGYVVYWQGIPTTIGVSYRVRGDVEAVGASYFGLRKSDAGGNNLADIAINTNGIALTGTFVATATTSYICLQTNGGYTDFDNLGASEA